MKIPTSGWWYVRFRIEWPQNADPSWHVDLLLAHKVILPALHQHKNDLALWRFHRRAEKDQVGHQFSFIFYSSPETAYQIYKLLKSDAILKEMKDAGMILEDIYDDLSKVAKPNIEDTSDSKWSPTMQKSWPYFIMGVSQMWLTLITEIVQCTSSEQKPSSLPKMLDFYQQVDHSITQLWLKESYHSLFHHLNAIFGYKPIMVHEAV